MARTIQMRAGVLALGALSLAGLAAGRPMMRWKRPGEHGRFSPEQIAEKGSRLFAAIVGDDRRERRIEVSPTTIHSADGAPRRFWNVACDYENGAFAANLVVEAETGEVFLASRVQPIEDSARPPEPDLAWYTQDWLRRLEILRPEESCAVVRIIRFSEHGRIVEWKSNRRFGTISLCGNSGSLASVTSKPRADAACAESGESCI